MARAKLKSKAKPVTAQADPTPVFPETAFIGLFADYRGLVAPTTEAADQFHWASLLASLSALVGRNAKLEGGPEGVIPVLHVALLGRTGKARKSTAMEDAVSLLVDAMPAAMKALVAERARSQFQVVDGDHLRKPTTTTARSRAIDPSVFELDVIRGAGSGEGLAEALADEEEAEDEDGPAVTGKRALVVVDELGALMERANRGSAGNLVELLLRLYDAPTKFDHRTRRASFSVTNGVGVFLGASTVEWIHRTLTEAQVRAGLVSRFLWIIGDRKPQPLARRPAINEEGHKAFLALAAERLADAAGKTFVLTTEADAFHQRRYEVEYHRDDETALQSAAFARTDGLALRLSLLLAIADGAKKVGLVHIEAAWSVVDYSRHVSGDLIEHISNRTMMSAEDRVLNAVRRAAKAGEGKFRRRSIFQNVKGTRGMTSKVFGSAWEVLATKGAIQRGSGGHWRLPGE